ncbi:MAG: 50S ribosomal protein L21 [Candidatus Dojkabacteria bacterium]|nr:MAG: 50S ribosomal protein L21 [Candidatus Dojkabacteria bacterium]
MANEKSATKKKTTVKKAAPKAVKANAKPAKTSTKAKPAAKAEVKATKAKVVKQNGGFAVIEIAGTQLKVEEGKKYTINKIDGAKGEKVSAELYKVLMTSDGDSINVGKPYVDGAKVELKVDTQKRDKKVDTRTFKSKARYRRKRAIRPMITRIEVTKIA